MQSTFVEPGANLFFREPDVLCSGLSPAVDITTGSFPTIIPLCPLTRTPSTDAETPFSFRGRPTSFTIGGFLGYTVQLGDIVVGIEGDAAYKEGTTRRALPAQATATYTSAVPTAGVAAPTVFTAQRSELFTGSAGQGWDGSLRLRAGFLVTPSVLVYGTAGVAFGEVHGSLSYSATTTYTAAYTATPGFTVLDSPAPPGTVLFVDRTQGAGRWSDVRIGWTAGGGVETALFDGIKLRLEYRYADLGEYSKYVPLVRTCTSGSYPCPAPNVGSTNARIDLTDSFHTVRIGLGIDF